MRALSAIMVLGLCLVLPAPAYAAPTDQCLVLDAYIDPDNTIRICTQATELPDISSKVLAEVHLKRAAGYYWLHRDDLSLVDVNAAIKLDPSLGAAYLRRAWIYLFMQKPRQAYADLEAALERDPQNADVYFAIGVACNWNHCSAKKQLAAYDKALSLKPDHYLAGQNRAHVLFFFLAKADEALAELDKILSVDPEVVDRTPVRVVEIPRPYKMYGTTRRLRAQIYDSLQQWDKALADYQYLIDHYPDNPLAYYWQAQIYYHHLNDKIRALAELDQALKINPDFVKARAVRAWVHFVLNNYDEAWGDANRVIEQGSLAESATAYEVRAGISESKGDYDQALADLQTAVQHDNESLRRYQNKLIQAGYYFGSVDGIYSEELSYGLTACLIDPQC
jgi:tetratricopeptide (TPR) repeat protein